MVKSSEVPSVDLAHCSVHGPADLVKLERRHQGGIIHSRTLTIVRCDHECDQALGWVLEDRQVLTLSARGRTVITSGTGDCEDAGVMSRMVSAKHDQTAHTYAALLSLVALLLACAVFWNPAYVQQLIDAPEMDVERAAIFGMGIIVAVAYLTVRGICAMRRDPKVNAAAHVRAMPTTGTPGIPLLTCDAHPTCGSIQIRRTAAGNSRYRRSLTRITCSHQDRDLGWAFTEWSISMMGKESRRFQPVHAQAGAGTFEDADVTDRMVEARRDEVAFASALMCAIFTMGAGAIACFARSNVSDIIPMVDLTFPITAAIILLASCLLSRRVSLAIYDRMVSPDLAKRKFEDKVSAT